MLVSGWVMLRMLQTAGRLAAADVRPLTFCAVTYPEFIPTRFFRQDRTFPLVTRMGDKVTVRRREGEDRFTFSFHLHIPDLKINKQFNLNREVKEETTAFIDRLGSNIAKAKKKKKNVVDDGEEERRLKPQFLVKDLAVQVISPLLHVTRSSKLLPPLCRVMPTRPWKTSSSSTMCLW